MTFPRPAIGRRGIAALSAALLAIGTALPSSIASFSISEAHAEEPEPAAAQVNPATGIAYPDHLTNGNFAYPAMSDLIPADGSSLVVAAYNQPAAQYYAEGSDGWKSFSSFDKANWFWDSAEVWDDDHARTVELLRDKSDPQNQFSQLRGNESLSTVFQDIQTDPGEKYYWSLRHASLDTANKDTMNVLIGDPSAPSL